MPNQQPKKAIHAGHRDRMRKKFIANSGHGLSDHELLELLLYHSIPRMNTNDISHYLIDELGSLGSVMNADPHRIESVRGAGPATALMLSLIKEINRRVALEKYDMNRFVADSLTKVGNFFMDYYRGREEEELCALFLDNSLRLIELRSVSKGSVNSTCVDVKSITKHAMNINATNVIIAHNHPHGVASPSSYDRQLSLSLDASLKAVEITLIDHMIVSDLGYTPTLHTRALDPTQGGDKRIFKYFFDN